MMPSVSSDAARPPRILFLVPGDYESLVTKGVAGGVLDRDESGFFERVLTVHPFSNVRRTIHLNDVHTVHELARPRVGGSAGKLLRYLAWGPTVIRSTVAVARLARRESIDIIRATDPHVVGLFGWMTSRLVPGARFCVSIHADYEKRHALDPAHGAPTIFGRRWPAARLARFVLRRASLVMPIRESLVASVLSAGVAPDRICVIPHGIDTDWAEAPLDEVALRRGLNIPAGRPIVSFVGRLSAENYVDDVLLAAMRLAEDSDAVFVLAGGGPLEHRLRARVEGSPALRRSVVLTGFQPLEVTRQLRRISTAALCLMGGFSLIEACVAGCPVVSYDVEWHHELVATDRTGALVAEGDVAGVEQALRHLLRDRAAAAQMGRTARGLALSRHSSHQAAAQRRACYERLLTQSA